MMLDPYRKPREWFQLLVGHLAPDAILDIGSRNGKDALILREYAPDALIMAFEATPESAHIMEADPELKAARIEARHAAVGATDGTATFSIFSERKRMGSLRVATHRAVIQTIAVPATRVDSIPEIKDKKNIALWVDVEGATYEVLDGAQQTLLRVLLLHLEVETAQLWEGQKTVDDIRRLLKKQGFVSIAERIEPEHQQGNIVCIRETLLQDPRVARFIRSQNRRAALSRFASRIHLKRYAPFLFSR